MASFSERIGKRASKTLLQLDGLDRDTRTALWNALVVVRDLLASIPTSRFGMDTAGEDITTYLWTRVYKKPRDEMQGTQHIWDVVKSAILRGEWFEAFDLIEALVKRLNDPDNRALREFQPVLVEHLNDVFERELVGYRFVGTEISPITDDVQVAAINEALETTNEHTGAHHHLKQAIKHFSDRDNPDYLNSIKESISAVEGIVRTFSGGKTLGVPAKRAGQ